MFIDNLNEEKWEMVTDYVFRNLNVEKLFDVRFVKCVRLWHVNSPIITTVRKIKSNN